MLVFTSFVLLLFAELISLWASPAAEQLNQLHLNSLDFYYKKDAYTRFLDLKQKWQTRHQKALPYWVASQLSEQAYAKATIESPISIWQYDTANAPNILEGKAHVFNKTKQPLFNVALQVTLRAKAAQLAVTPETQMTDFDHLEATAEWQELSEKAFVIPVIAPDEDILLPLAKFSLMAFKQQFPDQWPLKVQVTVDSPALNYTEKTISLIPDYFVMPALY
ncbi:MAG: hypothetical protein AAGI66_08420 [Cyanobacteria bacterium P01_H01_bin.74]